MLRKAQNPSRGTLSHELRVQLTQPYSENNLLAIQEKYAAIVELSSDYSRLKERNESGYKSDNDKAYRHHVIHFQTSIINFLLAQLNTHPCDEEARKYLDQIVKLNLQMVKCQHNPIKMLQDELAGGTINLLPSLDHYNKEKRSENDDLAIKDDQKKPQSSLQSSLNFLKTFNFNPWKKQEVTLTITETIKNKKGYGTIN